MWLAWKTWGQILCVGNCSTLLVRKKISFFWYTYKFSRLMPIHFLYPIATEAPIILLSVHTWTSEGNILHLYQESANSMTCKLLFGKFSSLWPHNGQKKDSVSFKTHFLVKLLGVKGLKNKLKKNWLRDQSIFSVMIIFLILTLIFLGEYWFWSILGLES